MLQEKITGILEGAEPDTPHRLSYCTINFPLPDFPAYIINHQRLVLHGKLEDLGVTRSFRQFIPPTKSIQGIKLLDYSKPNNPGWLGWVFGMPRAIVTSDGKMYLNDIFFEPDWQYFHRSVKRILEDCFNFYTGLIDEEQLQNTQRNLL